MGDNDHSIRTQLRNLPVLKGGFSKVAGRGDRGGVKEPHAMTLSTVDEQSYPDARILILKSVDARGWNFAAKADSPKGQQLDSNGHAALTFYWPEVGRQIRLRGRAVVLPEAKCMQDFAARPLLSKASAVASKQSQVLADRDELIHRVAEVQDAVTDVEEQGFRKWKVYAVAPKEVEFWQGSNDRLHRIRYMTETKFGPWRKDLLWP